MYHSIGQTFRIYMLKEAGCMEKSLVWCTSHCVHLQVHCVHDWVAQWCILWSAEPEVSCLIALTDAEVHLEPPGGSAWSTKPTEVVQSQKSVSGRVIFWSHLNKFGYLKFSLMYKSVHASTACTTERPKSLFSDLRGQRSPCLIALTDAKVYLEPLGGSRWSTKPTEATQPRKLVSRRERLKVFL